MTIEDNPNRDHKKKVLVRWQDKNGNPRQLLMVNRLEGEILFLRKHHNATPAELAEISCEAFVEHFFNEQETRGQAEISRTGSKLTVKRLLKDHLERPFALISIEDYRTIRERLEGSSKEENSQGECAPTKEKPSRYQPKTVLRYCKLMEQMCNLAQTLHIIEVNRARIANGTLSRKYRVNQEISAPTTKQLGAIRLHCFPLAGAVIDTMTEAGAETVDISRLEWSDVDFDKRLIRFRGLQTKVDPDGKTLERFVPMSLVLTASLLRWRFVNRGVKSSLVFPNSDGRKYIHSTLYSVINPPQLRAGLARDLHRQLERHRATPKPSLPDRTFRPPQARFSSLHFRNYAAKRWSRNLGLKTLAYRLGIAVITADQKFGSEYNQRFAEDYLLARRNGEMLG